MEGYLYISGIVPAQALTNSYVAGNVLDTKIKQDRLALLLAATLGSLTSIQYKIEYSTDQVTWYQETASSVSGGTATDTQVEHTISADGNYHLVIPLVDRYVRVSVKGTGTVTGSSITVNAALADVDA